MFSKQRKNSVNECFSILNHLFNHFTNYFYDPVFYNVSLVVGYKSLSKNTILTKIMLSKGLFSFFSIIKKNSIKYFFNILNENHATALSVFYQKIMKFYPYD